MARKEDGLPYQDGAVLNVVLGVDEQDVLRLQVRVRELVLMQDCEDKGEGVGGVNRHQGDEARECMSPFEGRLSACDAVLTSDGPDDAVGHVLDVLDGERLEVVLLEEVVGAEAQQLEGDAHVSVVVEPVQHAHTRTEDAK